MCDDYKTTEKNNPLQIRMNDDHKEIDFYLTNVIEDINDYIDLLREAENCRMDDYIKVHINCYGGNMDVALNIYDCLKSSSANVEMYVEGACCSCASMIMLAGNLWRLSPHCYVMIHSWSSMMYGKWAEIKARYKYDEKILEKQFREIYKNFLTEQEITECLNGKDFYFDSDEIGRRIDNFQKKELEMHEFVKKIQNKYSDMAEKEINQHFKKINKEK